MKHKHAELVKHGLDGQQIQMKDGGGWYPCDVSHPLLYPDFEYRIKPAKEERVYPVTQMSDREMENEWCSADKSERFGDAMRRLANLALRHACDKGQVVTREEFDRAVGDRKVRDMAVAQAVKEACVTAAQDAADGYRILGVERVDVVAVLAVVRP